LGCMPVLALLSAPMRAAPEPVSGPLVVSEGWPECTNLLTWTRDVMRLEKLEHGGETAQAKAFFHWLRLFSRMASGGMIQAYEGAYGEEQYVLDPHKNLFVYGWGYCDTSSRIAEAAWVEFKKDQRAAERVCVMHDNRGFHTMYRLRLDGKYAAFDPRYGYYLVERDAEDARVLDWEEVGVDENIHRNKSYRHRSRPFFEYFGLERERAFLIQPRYFASEEDWRKAGEPPECVFGNPMYRMGTRLHDMDFRLARGTTLERFWNNSARAFYTPAGKHALREEPFLPSGRFYRVTETMADGNWVKHDPNYSRAKPYLETVPMNEGYKAEIAGGRTIGQAWGRITYEPDLREPLDSSTLDSTLVSSAAPPYLRPATDQGGGQTTFDFYSPYILVDGVLSGEFIGAAGDDLKAEIRVQRAKAANAAEPDAWSRWDVLHRGPGAFAVPLGRPRFNGRDASIHGVYRFQVRVSAGANSQRPVPAGLARLKVEASFENGIMSIPQIFAGRNIIHFKVRDARRIRGPIRVTYSYQTAGGEKRHTQTLNSADFRGHVATYTLDARGLTRCNSVAVAY